MAQPDDVLDDEDYPAYTMGRAAEIIGCSPDFLRRLGEAKLIDPYRSGGGHRRYSRYQLRLAARAREMCDHGIDMASAVRSSSSKTNSKKPCGTTNPSPLTTPRPGDRAGRRDRHTLPPINGSGRPPSPAAAPAPAPHRPARRG